MAKKKKKTASKTEEPVKKKAKRVRGTATAPLGARAQLISETCTAMEALCMSIAAELATWTAGDGKSLRQVAASPDSSKYWSDTLHELGRGVTGASLVKDTLVECGAIANQLASFRWGFDAVKALAEARSAEEKPAKTSKVAKKKKKGKKAEVEAEEKPAKKKKAKKKSDDAPVKKKKKGGKKKKK